MTELEDPWREFDYYNHVLAETQREEDERKALNNEWWMPYHLGRQTWWPYDTSKAWFWKSK
jgi:hypothetical protein